LAVESEREMPDHVLIFLNGQRVAVEGQHVFESLVEFLRHSCGLPGTKVGCGEGDCGACTVLVGRPIESGTLRYRTISSCLQAMYQVDGMHIVTIEGLTPPDGLSPLQQAMVEHHGSQCGYCTPGMVAALEGIFEARNAVDTAALRTGLTGNLCRCTGYLPILEAGLAVDRARLTPLNRRYPCREMAGELAARAALPIRIEQDGRIFFSPVNLDEAVAFRTQHKTALIVSGGTETGLARNRRGTEPDNILSLSRISELRTIRQEKDVLSVGANVTWTDLEEFARDKVPLLDTLTRRFGSPQIRNAGTLVGNIAFGSPVADSLCILLVMGAELELAGPGGRRRQKVEGFHRGPRQTSLAPDEIITKVDIPLPGPNELVKIYKISKRKELDTSTFRAAIRIEERGGLIHSAAVAFSGVGPTAARLPQTETFLVGQVFSESTFRRAGKHARAEVEPISDVRGSSRYRLQLAENILLKFHHEVSGGARQEVAVGE
jgi:xanthine dehydrogenase small subunit